MQNNNIREFMMASQLILHLVTGNQCTYMQLKAKILLRGENYGDLQTIMKNLSQLTILNLTSEDDIYLYKRPNETSLTVSGYVIKGNFSKDNGGESIE